MDIKARIKEQGFTISEVAAQMTTKDSDGNIKVGISQSAMSQLISGNPTLNRLQEIAAIIGVSVPQLLADGTTANDFTAFVRNGGEIQAFDSPIELKEYVDNIISDK